MIRPGPAEWFCRVCGAPAESQKGATRYRNVIALPCGHEQPTDDKGYRGLDYRPAPLEADT